MPIHAGWIVGPSSFAEYQPHTVSYGPEVPLETVQSSCINSELIFRGSQIQSGLGVALPQPSPVGIHRRRPTTGMHDDGDRRLRFRPTLTRPSPLMPAPEESRTAKLQEHTQEVMSKAILQDMDRYDRPEIAQGASLMCQGITCTRVWAMSTPYLAGQMPANLSPATGRSESRRKIFKKILSGHVITTTPRHE